MPYPIASFFDTECESEDFMEIMNNLISGKEKRKVWVWWGHGKNGKTTLFKQVLGLGFIKRFMLPYNDEQTFFGIRDCQIIEMNCIMQPDLSRRFREDIIYTYFPKTF